MTKQPPDPKAPPTPTLTASLRDKLLVAAEAQLRHVAAEATFDLKNIDLGPCLDWIIAMTMRYENIATAIAKLPTVTSPLQFALNHEAQHAVSFLSMKPDFDFTRGTKVATPAPLVANCHINLVLPQVDDHQLSEVGYQCRTQGGKRLTKTEMLRGLIKFLLDDLAPAMDLKQVSTEDDFLDRLRQAAKKL